MSDTAPDALPPARTHRHVPALDGIRGLAAAMVMTFHFARPEVPGAGAQFVGAIAAFGWTGVDLFFVLSGFLISGILVDTRDRPDYFRTFYKRRSLRIFPLYFAFVALYLYVFIPWLGGPRPDVLDRQAWLWTYTSNFDVALHDWYPGTGSHANNLWSLAIEEQFYLVFPLVVFLVPRRRLWIAAASCVVGALLARFAIEYVGYPTRVAYVLTFTRLDGLGLGILLALLARQGDALRRLVPAAWATLGVAATVCAVVAVRTGRFNLGDWSTILYAQPMLAFAFAALLLLTVADGGSPTLKRLFESRVLRFFGLYSYGLYIWHPLVGRIVRSAGIHQGAMAEALGSGAAAVLVVLVVKTLAATLAALASYYVIERPFLLLKDRRPRATIQPAAVNAAPL